MPLQEGIQVLIPTGIPYNHSNVDYSNAASFYAIQDSTLGNQNETISASHIGIISGPFRPH